MAKTAVTYSERPDATPEAELDTLAAVFRFVLFDSHASKGGRHDLTSDPTTKQTTGTDQEGTS